MKKRTVALYSPNTVLSTIGACLQKNTVFQVEQIDGPSEIIGKVSPPDVILFDFETAQPHFFLSMMRDHPTTMFIGVDLANNKMLVLSVDSSRQLTIEDLVQAIEKRPFSSDL